MQKNLNAGTYLDRWTGDDGFSADEFEPFSFR
jgi:hypothetical protein